MSAPSRYKTRSMSNIVVPVFRLVTDDGVSEEYMVEGLADSYGSQHVRLYDANGQPILTDSNQQLHTKAPVREPGVSMFDHVVCGSTPANTVQEADIVDAGSYRKFSLFLNLDSTGAPTSLLIEVLFLDPVHSHPHVYKQGPFSSLYYEDLDTADGLYECLSGDLLSELVSLRITCAGGAVAAYFTVTASMEFWG